MKFDSNKVSLSCIGKLHGMGIGVVEISPKKDYIRTVFLDRHQLSDGYLHIANGRGNSLRFSKM